MIMHVGSTACVIDNTHFSDDENSESVDDGTVVVISQKSRSNCIPEVVGK
jgi:hypothetical protein